MDNMYSGRKLDLTGQVFGKLTVLEPAGKVGGRTAWRCRCECGNETVVTTGNLRSGRTKSCGCGRARMDLAGQVFGRLTALEPAENIGTSTAWRCRCECGKEVVVRTNSLASGKTRSCGCLRDEKMDLTGDRYGMLTVLGRAPGMGGQDAWLCRCECGNEVTVRMCDLRTGHTKSCGCLVRGPDLTGQVFGRLTVLGRAEGSGKGARWRCRCECGNETVVTAGNLRSGGTRSCGCLRRGKRGTAASKKEGHAMDMKEAPMKGAPMEGSGAGGRPQDAAERHKGPPRLDLTGQRFGRLTVLDRAPDIGGRTAWRCRCDCGNEAIVKTASLRSGNTRSCGCLSYARQGDLTGRRFGHLTVLERVVSNGRSAWRCQCDCGNETVVRAYYLLSGKTKGCGCQRGVKRMDLTGMKFGHLTALEPAEDINGQTTWLCRCDCGREAVMRTGYLTGGRMTHYSDPDCSCTKKNLRDLTGRKFGHLTVTGPDKATRLRSYWRCRCDCGRETVVGTGNLKSGKVTCCGHPDCPHSPKRREALAGKTCGWLTALERVEDIDGKPAWRCRCECGNEVTVEASKLRQGRPMSCGCRTVSGGKTAPDAARAGAD